VKPEEIRLAALEVGSLTHETPPGAVHSRIRDLERYAGDRWLAATYGFNQAVEEWRRRRELARRRELLRIVTAHHFGEPVECLLADNGRLAIGCDPRQLFQYDRRDRV
jgi:hypothetical protein